MSILNLIPIYPLDGYRILKAFLQLLVPYKKALKISNIVSTISFIFFMFINFISLQILWSMFLLIEQIKNIKNYKKLYKRFLIDKTNKKLLKKYKMIEDYQMYKDVNNYKIENDRILSDFDIATIELARFR